MRLFLILSKGCVTKTHTIGFLRVFDYVSVRRTYTKCMSHHLTKTNDHEKGKKLAPTAEYTFSESAFFFADGVLVE